MSTQTIEFATNSSNNWFTVCYDWDQCQSILEQARKLGVIPSIPRKYTHPNTRWIVYFNNGVNDQFMNWVRTTFSVRNVERIVGAMRSEAALKYENTTYCQRATISRYSLSEVKTAMVSVIGTPAEIREFFSLYNIKVNGVAVLPQCLELIEELDKLDEVVAELRKPKTDLAVTVQEPVESLSNEEIPVLTAEPEDDLADPVAEQNVKGIDVPIDFDPWTMAELTDKKMTIKNLLELAELSNIPLTNQQKRMTKPNLAAYLMPILNEIGLAEHMA